jgi:small-conductance mechanosensitive channel/CRP-like cAMP-binding protein
MPELFSPDIWTLDVVGTAITLAALSFLLLRAARPTRPVVFRVAAFAAFAVLGVLGAAAFGALGAAHLARPLRAVSVFILGACVIVVAGLLIFRAILPRLRLTPPRILQDVAIAVGAIVWGLVLLQNEARVDLGSILATSAVITAVLAFSLQDTLGNVLGGIALQVDRSIQVGDWIEIDAMVGRVVEISWRQTSLETRNWETVVIPNSVLMKTKFMVLGRRQGQPVQQRQWVYFTADFQHTPSKVIDAVERGLRTAQLFGVAVQPPPSCFLMDVSGAFARYGVDYWLTELGAKNPVDSDVRVHIYSALRRAGVPFPIPTHNVTMTEDTIERRSSRAELELSQRLAAISKIELFASLSADELRVLAGRLAPSPFAKGDILTRQGDPSNSLYILVNGHADVFVESDGNRARVTELGPGSVVGEMGLMTGEPRSATVVAASPVESFRLDKVSFRDLLVSRPDVADRVSALLAVARRARGDHRPPRRRGARRVGDAAAARHQAADPPVLRPRALSSAVGRLERALHAPSARRTALVRLANRGGERPCRCC